MAQIFGGGNASAEAQKSRELQQVAADRQLAELRNESQRAGLNRRRPRGRRLFAEDGGKTNLA